MGPGGPSAPEVYVSWSDAVYADDVLSASASGSVDPAGRPITYEFEWVLGSDVAQRNSGFLSSQTSTLGVALNKGESWQLRVRAIAEDGRASETVEIETSVLNSVPTVRTAGLSAYRFVKGDAVEAFTVGYEDVDGDAEATTYRWTLSDGQSYESQSPSIEWSRFSVPAMPEASALTLSVEVIPNDGEEAGAPMVLGPYAIRNDVTRWMELIPNVITVAIDPVFDEDTSRFMEHQGLIIADPTHERMLDLVGGSLWEYTPEHRFVELSAVGDAPTGTLRAFYDDSEGSERFVVLAGTLGGSLSVHSLNVAARGREEWRVVSLANGQTAPDFRCYANIVFDSATQTLRVHGGSPSCAFPVDDSTLYNDVIVATLQGDEVSWRNEGVSAMGAQGSFGAVAVLREGTREAYFFGGRYADPICMDTVGCASPVYKMDLDSGDVEEVGPALPGEPIGVMAFYSNDENAERIVGAMGVDDTAASVDQVWELAFSENAQPVFSTRQGYPSSLDSTVSIDVDGSPFSGELGGRGMYGTSLKLGADRLIWPGRTAIGSEAVLTATEIFQLDWFSGTRCGSEQWCHQFEVGVDAPHFSVSPPALWRDGDSFLYYWGAGTTLPPEGLTRFDGTKAHSEPFDPFGSATPTPFLVRETGRDPVAIDFANTKLARNQDGQWESFDFSDQNNIAFRYPTLSTGCSSNEYVSYVSSHTGIEISCDDSIMSCEVQVFSMAMPDPAQIFEVFGNPYGDSNVAILDDGTHVGIQVQTLELLQSDPCATLGEWQKLTLVGGPLAVDPNIAFLAMKATAEQSAIAILVLASNDFRTLSTRTVEFRKIDDNTYNAVDLESLYAPQGMLYPGVMAWDSARGRMLMVGGVYYADGYFQTGLRALVIRH
ncbi:MAG: hypothetical protein R3A47_04280 [Polyangiales bacterium]